LLNEKYNPDNLFKKSQQTQIIEENIPIKNDAMVIYKESILKKIWNQIKIIFQKNNKS
jgi:hypothetical protein